MPTTTSRSVIHPVTSLRELSPVEYCELLDQQKNERVFMPGGNWSTTTLWWRCTDCDHVAEFSFPDEQFPTLYPHIDVHTVQLEGDGLVEAYLVRPVCPECHSFEFEPKLTDYNTNLNLEVRGVTIRYVSTQDHAEIHIDE